MKKKVAALTLGAFLLTSGFGYAAQVGQKITAYFDNYIVAVNGSPVYSSTGAKPLNYNGSIYVPMRMAAEALNAQVSYDESTKTINLIPGSSSTENAYMLQIMNLNNKINSLNADLTAKNNEINDLKAKISDLEKKNSSSSSSSSSSSNSRDARNLEDKLERNYEYYKKGTTDREIRFRDYRVYDSRKTIDIEMTADIYKDSKAWTDRNKSDFQSFIERDVAREIESYFDRRDYDYYVKVVDRDGKTIGDYTIRDRSFKVNSEY